MIWRANCGGTSGFAKAHAEGAGGHDEALAVRDERILVGGARRARTMASMGSS